MKMFPLGTRLSYRQAGFSLIEMTIVLAILAIGATTAMRIASNKMEQTITSRTVSELSIAAEAAYECYVASPSHCATGDPKGWTFSEGWKDVYLPDTFPNQYMFTSTLLGENTRKAEIRVDMKDTGRALRVARAFGSSATAADTFVVVTLGVPGTESALAAALDETKKYINRRIDEEGKSDMRIDSNWSRARGRCCGRRAWVVGGVRLVEKDGRLAIEIEQTFVRAP